MSLTKTKSPMNATAIPSPISVTWQKHRRLQINPIQKTPAPVLTPLPNPSAHSLALSRNLSGRVTTGAWISASSQPTLCLRNVPF